MACLGGLVEGDFGRGLDKGVIFFTGYTFGIL
jgi:hypothetical protein